MYINIYDKLLEKNMSRYELAKRIGVTYPTIDNIFKGKSTSIKLDILEAICIELECTPNDILLSNNALMQRLLAYYQRINEHQNKK